MERLEVVDRARRIDEEVVTCRSRIEWPHSRSSRGRGQGGCWRGLPPHCGCSASANTLNELEPWYCYILLSS